MLTLSPSIHSIVRILLVHSEMCGLGTVTQSAPLLPPLLLMLLLPLSLLLLLPPLLLLILLAAFGCKHDISFCEL